MQSGLPVEPDHVFALDADHRPQLVVAVIGVGHHGIQAIVAAFELDQNQDAPGRRGGVPGACLRPSGRMRLQQSGACQS